MEREEGGREEERQVVIEGTGRRREEGEKAYNYVGVKFTNTIQTKSTRYQEANQHV